MQHGINESSRAKSDLFWRSIGSTSPIEFRAQSRDCGCRSVMAIPVQNIYYLLSYAWNRLEERDRIRVDVEDATDLVELFARVISTALYQLARRGLDRGYVEKHETLRVLRGRVCIPETINILGFNRGELVCDFEELTHDVLINQIIKA